MHKIHQARSSYSISAMKKHTDKVKYHKSILLSKSPSVSKVDPLVDKHFNRVSTQQLISTPNLANQT